MWLGQVSSSDSGHAAPVRLEGYRLGDRPMIVDGARARALDAAAEAVARVLLSALQRSVEKDADACAVYLGLAGGGAWLTTLLEQCTAQRLFFRADLVEGPDGFQVVELNGPNAGGWVVSITAAPLLAASRALGFSVRSVDTTKALLEHVLACHLAQHPGRASRVHLAIVVADTNNEFDAPTQQACRDRLDAASKAAGVGATLSFAPWGALAFRAEGVFLGNRRIDALFEEAPDGGTARLRAFRESRRGNVDLFYGPCTTLLNDKRLLAMLHAQAEAGELIETDAAVVRSLIPWTARFSDAELTYQGETCTAVQLAEREPSRWVLKRAASFGGRHVLLGDSVPRAAWQAAIARARDEGDWVLQQFIRSQGRRLLHDESLVHCIWGVFVLGGAARGGFVRVIPPDGHRHFAAAGEATSSDDYQAFVVERSLSSDNNATILPIIYEASA